MCTFATSASESNGGETKTIMKQSVTFLYVANFGDCLCASVELAIFACNKFEKEEKNGKGINKVNERIICCSADPTVDVQMPRGPLTIP